MNTRLLLACAALAASLFDPAGALAQDATQPTAGTIAVKLPAATSEAKLPAVKPPTAADQKTAQAVSTIPGVQVDPSQMATPTQDPPIKGFHPIKKLLQPVENLEKSSVALGQQVMRLEGPIASLQTPMVGLQTKMTSVEQRMAQMQGKLSSVQGSMTGVTKDMHDIGEQMHGVRGDLGGMRGQIVQLEAPIKGLREPITMVARPVEGVQTQLTAVEKELAELKTLLGTILFAIFLAAGAIALGTPVAAVLIYKHRRKLFPNSPERDFPVVAPSAVKQ
jgi:DNA-binding FrmR family transcriptional regulator